MLPATAERRFNKVEIRAEDGSGEGKTLVGRACVYNQWSELLFDYFYEQIAPGAFDESLASGRDVYASIDHDANRILGRLSAGTLTLSPGPEGIDVACPIQDYSYTRDLLVALKSGDLRGMSFIFDVLSDKWELRDGKPARTVLKADIYEVSFVHFPAYPETSAGIRQAYPVAGEQRARERAFQALHLADLERCRHRLRLAAAL